MRGDLDETLARLARREEALRRRADDRDDTAAPPGPPGLGGNDARNAGPGRYGARHAGVPGPGDVAGWGPVEEVAEAVRQVVGAHPGLAVTVHVEHAGRTYPLRVSWNGPDVTIGLAPPAPPAAPVAPAPPAGPAPATAPVEPPPAWPLSGRTVPAWAPGPDGLTPDPAARLAELIRRDPSLLDELDPRR
ncbi:hypothetical protein [Micromonospora parathelypteridis]|uniref:Uncharacterized protein n=1 Tax=Micromonospora parathelypteridis TaxID=1839617 RepID=A0A840VY33_9ACTN|nr:hypothetical protein [Micromonospora parathelypteridis]MBB5477888.1 hypothetical protein [Micromonospora parathelypteridis]GGO12147.1 hypothetical protein GCM10011576_21280 [Micromonospora parathelypteridis]